MSLREKQKAKLKHKEETEKKFEQETGIKNKAKDLTLDKMMEKFRFDMAVMEKKESKMKEMDRDGVDYDFSEIEVDEKDFNKEEARQFAEFLREKKSNQDAPKQQYEDQPYKVAEDELDNTR